MKPTEIRKLTLLQKVARMKSEAELAKLATVAQSRSRLVSAIEALNATEAPLDGTGDAGGPAEVITDPAMLRARLAHANWADGRKRLLNQRLAMVNAEYLARRPAAAQAFGRAEVLGELVERGWEGHRREEAKGKL